MNKIQLKQEKGQAVVLVALLMVGLIALLGLVFDVGNAYAQRRGAQNGADAGALAGAQKLATKSDNSAATEQAVLTAINSYAGKNGVPNPSTNIKAYFINSSGNQVGTRIGTNSSVPSNAVGVSVNSIISFPTLFLVILNENNGVVGAAAGAMTGPAGGVYGISPWCLNWDAASAAIGVQVNLGSSVGSGGTYNYESIDTSAEGLGDFATAMKYGIATNLKISTRKYKSILSPTFTPAEKDGLLDRLNSAPGETWNNFSPGSRRVMYLPVMDGTAGSNYVNIKAFRAFFLESINTQSSQAYGRFIKTIAPTATLDFSAPDTGVHVTVLTQ